MHRNNTAAFSSHHAIEVCFAYDLSSLIIGSRLNQLLFTV